MRKRLAGFIAAALCLCGAVSCNENDEPAPGPDEPQRGVDIIENCLVHHIDIDDPEGCRLPVSVADKLEISLEEGSPVELVRESNADGSVCLVPRLTGNVDGVKLVKAKITPVGNRDMGRNLLLVLRRQNNTENTRQESLSSVYSSYIGKSTRCWAELGNSVLPVLDYDVVSQLGEEYLNVNTTLNHEDMFELCGESYQKCMESWGLHIGASFRKVHAMPSRYAHGAPKVGPRPTKPTTFSGSLNFDISGSVSSSADFEYYVNMFFVRKAEIALDMSRFEYSDNNPSPDPMILAMVTGNFLNDLARPDSTTFNTNEFYDKWGTDVITTGAFGGYCLNIYGREENIYEESLGIDAGISFRASRGNPDGKDWVYIYQAKNSPYIQGDISGNYSMDNYSESSRAATFYKCVGGNMTNNDAAKWIEGFNNSAETDKWSLIGYSRLSDTESVRDSISNLYPIEFVAHDVVDAYYEVFKDALTEADRATLANATANAWALVDAKQDYLARHATEMRPRTPLVVCDIMMRNGSNGHKKGEPRPFTAPDPNYPKKIRRYYPMMANKFAPYDEGYAMETTQNDYYVSVNDSEDHYWYYALAHIDDCYGITDVQFQTSAPEWYTIRGDNAYPGSGFDIKKNHVCVRFEAPGTNDSNKITAFGLYKKSDDLFTATRVMSATGGAELRAHPSSDEQMAWENFWNAGGFYNKTQWNEGTITVHCKIWPCMTRTPLDLERVKNTYHPQKWGE